jgi:hypothetical protein
MTRALITEGEHEYIAGKHGDDRRYEAISRVRRRIREELPSDVRLLGKHHPALLDELRETVNGETEDCHCIENWMESNGGVVHRSNTPWQVARFVGDIEGVSLSNDGRPLAGDDSITIETLPDEAITSDDVLWINTPDRPREHRFTKVTEMTSADGDEGIDVTEENLETPYRFLRGVATEEGLNDLKDGDHESEELTFEAKDALVEEVKQVRKTLKDVNSGDEIREMKRRLTHIEKQL